MAYNVDEDELTIDVRVSKQTTGTLNLGNDEFYIIADGTSNPVTIKLPQGKNANPSIVGKMYTIFCKSTNNAVNLETFNNNDRVRVGTSVNDWSNGGAPGPFALTAGKTMWIIFTGEDGPNGEWHVIAEFDGTI